MNQQKLAAIEAGAKANRAYIAKRTEKHRGKIPDPEKQGLVTYLETLQSEWDEAGGAVDDFPLAETLAGLKAEPAPEESKSATKRKTAQKSTAKAKPKD